MRADKVIDVRHRQDPRAYRSITGSQRCLLGRLIQAIVVLYSTNCRQPLPSRPSDRRLPTISGGPHLSGTPCIGSPSNMPSPAPVSLWAGPGVIAISPCALHGNERVFLTAVTTGRLSVTSFMHHTLHSVSTLIQRLTSIVTVKVIYPIEK